MNRNYGLRSLLVVLGVLLLVGCAGTESSRSTGTFIDDTTIATKVKSKLAADSLTQAIKIEVEVYDGVVQLSGFVENTETIQRAEEIVRSVGGVKEVKNSLSLR